jgi:predicted XRE-type DNA-binding protein
MSRCGKRGKPHAYPCPYGVITSTRWQQIAAIVKKNRWTQTEAAQRCGITQPRMNDLLRGRVSRFSLEALVNISTAIGRRVHMELESV